MPKQKTITVYQYKELSDKAKESARDWWFSCGMSTAWEDTKEDAKGIGLELQGMDRGNMHGDFTVSAEDCANLIIKNHGPVCDTHKTAVAFLADSKALREMDSDIATQADEENLQEMVDDFLIGICEDYRVIYQKDEEYQQSEEYISEIMEINEYEFDENGRRV